MAIKKIARQAYRRLPENELYHFIDNVYRRMKEVPAYASLQVRVDALFIPLQQYVSALAAARNRGISEILVKNLMRKTVIGLVDELVPELEILAAGREQLIVQAGFRVQLANGARFKGGVLPAPQIVRAISTGKKGQIRISLKNTFPRAVRTHAFEFSLDQGLTWSRSEYNSNINFVVNGLPHAPDMWVRVRSLGAGTNKSEWSETVIVAVP